MSTHTTELAVGDGIVESLWVRIKEQTNIVDVIVGVYYKPPNQDHKNNELV